MAETTLQAPPPSPLTSFTEDEIMFRDNIRQFADEKVRPLVKEMDENGCLRPGPDPSVFPARADGHRNSGTIWRRRREILRGDSRSRGNVAGRRFRRRRRATYRIRWSITRLLRWGTDEQKKRYLPRMAADTCGAYALSEAGSGSDAFALQTRATLKGSDYVLNGRKLWITNGKEAGLFVLFATRRSGGRIQGDYGFHHRERFSRLHGGQEGRQAGDSRVSPPAN